MARRPDRVPAAERNRAAILDVLLNVLPVPIARRLTSGESVIADQFDNASILFADMVGFTTLSENWEPARVVTLLNDLFTRFDVLAEKHGVEKIRTIGDAYMAVAGAPILRGDHATVIAELAQDMAQELALFRNEHRIDIDFRIGINSGPVIGAIIGKSKFHYDVWGDAVNLAARMESHGVPGKIQVAESTYDLLQNEFAFEARGEIDVKGKGLTKTWFLTGNRI